MQNWQALSFTMQLYDETASVGATKNNKAFQYGRFME